MSSKINNPELFQQSRYLQLGLRSIQGRLTILFSITTIVILLVTSLYLQWVFNRKLHSEHNKFVNDKILEIRSIVRENPNDINAIDQTLSRESENPSSPSFYVRILDVHNTTLLKTKETNRLNFTEFPPPADIQRLDMDGSTWHSMSDRTYFLQSAWAGRNGTAERRLIQIGLDITDDEALVANYNRQIVLVILLGALLTICLSNIVVHHGLQPIRDITSTVEKVSASQLNERVSMKQWPNELIALASAFDDMLKRLDDSFSRLSQFSADIAHDLRTPVNNLMGEAQLALSRSRTKEEYQEIIVSSLEEYQRLSTMIDGLLFIARSEGDSVHIDKEWLKAEDIIQSVCEYYEIEAEDRHIEIIQNAENIQIYADPLLFRRALGNLISNALNYNAEGGWIKINVYNKDDFSRVTVEDNGKGIPEDQIDKVFDRLYRGGERNIPGTGLGLAIVRSIMTLHEGSVEIASDQNKGTSITLSFPIRHEIKIL